MEVQAKIACFYLALKPELSETPGHSGAAGSDIIINALTNVFHTGVWTAPFAQRGGKDLTSVRASFIYFFYIFKCSMKMLEAEEPVALYIQVDKLKAQGGREAVGPAA